MSGAPAACTRHGDAASARAHRFRRRRRANGIAVAALAVALLVSSATTTPATGSPNDERVQADRPGAGTQTTSACGTVTGVVLDAQTQLPLRGATVRLILNAPPDPSRPRPAAADRTSCRSTEATTDGDGTFRIEGVRPTRYVVQAAAAQHVTLFYGQTGNFVTAPTIAVTAGRTISDVIIRLDTNGIVSGRLYDDAGKGLAGVEIELIRDRARPGERAAVAFGQSVEGGAFRIADVPSGTYYVRAYVDGALRPTKSRRSAYVSTFYPDSPVIETAQPIAVFGGAERFDVDFTLLTAATHTVKGRLVDPGGPPLATATVSLERQPGMGGTQAAVAADGRFQFADVAPGRYVLLIRDPADGMRWGGALHNVDVSGDTDDIEIVAQPYVSVAGRVSAESGGPLPFDVTDVGVTVHQAQPGAGFRIAGFGGGVGGGVKADGSFALRAPAATSTIRVDRLPPRWFVKAVTLDGADVTDVEFDIAPGGTRRVEVVLSNRPGRVVGRAADRSGRAIINATVVVFPADQSRWQAPQLVRAALSHAEGAFEMENLAPGDYRAVAIEALAHEAWREREVLEQLWALATPFHLDEDEQQSLTLTVTAAPADAAGR